MNIRHFLALPLSALTLLSCTADPSPSFQVSEQINLVEVKKTVSSGRLLRIERFPSEYVEPRTVDIWLPELIFMKSEHNAIQDNPAFSQASDLTNLPVLYLHDGQMLFDSTQTWNKQEWRVDETLTELIESGQIHPLIVVAIWNNGDKRWSEYAPKPAFSPLSLDHPVPGRPNTMVKEVLSESYVQFLTEELVPYVDLMVDTDATPQGRMIIGSSMGGLISLYAHFERPDIFGRVGAVSTHWPIVAPDQFSSPSDNGLFNAFSTYITQKLDLDRTSYRRIYFDYGDQTLDAYYPPYQEDMNSSMLKHASENVEWTSFYDEGAAHDERSWAKRLNHVIVYIMGNYSPEKS